MRAGVRNQPERHNEIRPPTSKNKTFGHSSRGLSYVNKDKPSSCPFYSDLCLGCAMHFVPHPEPSPSTIGYFRSSGPSEKHSWSRPQFRVSSAVSGNNRGYVPKSATFSRLPGREIFRLFPDAPGCYGNASNSAFLGGGSAVFGGKPFHRSAALFPEPESPSPAIWNCPCFGNFRNLTVASGPKFPGSPFGTEHARFFPATPRGSLSSTSVPPDQLECVRLFPDPLGPLCLLPSPASTDPILFGYFRKCSAVSL